jgi:hypothetical protein
MNWLNILSFDFILETKEFVPSTYKQTHSFPKSFLIDQFLNGSSVGAKPLSFKNLFQKREYNKCPVACSFPPMYKSDSQYAKASFAQILRSVHPYNASSKTNFLPNLA